jgi:predicted sulfurtransferase
MEDGCAAAAPAAGEGGDGGSSGGCQTAAATKFGVAAGGDECVLLYYRYIDLRAGAVDDGASISAAADPRGAVDDGACVSAAADPRAAVKAFIERSCAGLRGRVRVAYDGINATIGGPRARLLQHIRDVRSHPVLSGGGGGPAIDFKLAASGGPRTEAAAAATNFHRLSVALRRELVTLGPAAAGRADPLSNGAPLLSAAEFHAELAAAAAGDGPPVALIDARNVYETAIGRFEAPGVQMLDPRTRQFSDFPAAAAAWAEASALQNKRLLMYCTGGVRCERASAYLRESGFENVAQLAGGIQRCEAAAAGR